MRKMNRKLFIAITTVIFVQHDNFILLLDEGGDGCVAKVLSFLEFGNFSFLAGRICGEGLKEGGGEKRGVKLRRGSKIQGCARKTLVKAASVFFHEFCNSNLHQRNCQR